MVRILLFFFLYAGLADATLEEVRLSRSADKVFSELVGTYSGYFESAYTETPYDDLNLNPCTGKCDTHKDPLTSLVFKLELKEERIPTIHFYRWREDHDELVPLDLLGKNCNSSIGELIDYTTSKKDIGLDDIDEFEISLKFALDPGRCSARISLYKPHQIIVSLFKSKEFPQTRAVLEIERSVRSGHYLYYKEKGEKIRVKIFPKESSGRGWFRSFKVCKVNKSGEVTDDCVATRRVKKSFSFPIAWNGYIGANYTWWHEMSPKLKSAYDPATHVMHTGKFLRMEDELNGLGEEL